MLTSKVAETTTHEDDLAGSLHLCDHINHSGSYTSGGVESCLFLYRLRLHRPESNNN